MNVTSQVEVELKGKRGKEIRHNKSTHTTSKVVVHTVDLDGKVEIKPLTMESNV